MTPPTPTPVIAPYAHRQPRGPPFISSLSAPLCWSLRSGSAQAPGVQAGVTPDEAAPAITALCPAAGGGGFSAFVSLGAIWQNEMSHRHVVTQRRDLILALPYLLHVTLDVAFCLSGPPYPLLESGATNLTPQAWTERLRISGENPMQTPSTLEELQEGSDDSLSVQALPGFDIGGVV